MMGVDRVNVSGESYAKIHHAKTHHAKIRHVKIRLVKIHLVKAQDHAKMNDWCHVKILPDISSLKADNIAMTSDQGYMLLKVDIMKTKIDKKVNGHEKRGDHGLSTVALIVQNYIALTVVLIFRYRIASTVAPIVQNHIVLTVALIARNHIALIVVLMLQFHIRSRALWPHSVEVKTQLNS
ncbi:hypothetical protein GL218_09072 [Daldinia childiae]|uniref:uncharacterized protein n=1 Tax=Daldinia childiae TaxID=326645 RepID=UPI0014483730|nr:uncharacterized protein GL218_09072 [Daldinia childiae]KAF3066582.1 hypothetical protein GL218_09072 [Daldinia childiae]